MNALLEPSTGDNRLPALAGEIEAAHRRCKAGVREALDAALAAGRALLEARELVPHGQWQDWLRANVSDVSVRTAQRYMKAAEKAKSDTVSFSSLRELLQPARPRPLAQGEWLFTFDADARLGSTPVPLDEPAVTRILRDAYRLMEPYRWNRLLKVLPEGRLQAIAREVGTAGSDRHDAGTWFHWATLSDPEDCDPGEAWFPILTLGRHYPDPEKDLPADKRRIGVRFEGSGLYHLKINASPVHLKILDGPNFPDLCTAVLAWKFAPQPRGRI